MRKVAIMAVLLSLVASFAGAHTPEERRNDLSAELAKHFNPEWIEGIFNHQDMCEGREIPTEVLRGGWKELEAKVMSESSLMRGELFFRANESVFRGAAERFNFHGGDLEPFVLAGILRVESDFGDIRTGTPVVRTLFETYHDVQDGPSGNSKRAKVMREEILPFFRMAESNNWDICDVLGSREGAFGYTHFIPGSLYLTVDGDDDGRVDIVHNVADAVYSSAHHLDKRDTFNGNHSLFSALMRYNKSPSYARIVLRYARELRDRVESASP